MAAYNSRTAENECKFVDASRQFSIMHPNQNNRKTSPDAKKHLPKLNTTDVDCISVKAKPKPRSKSGRGEQATAPRYRIQRVENRVAEDLQLTKFLDLDREGQASGSDQDQACAESDCGKSLSDSFVSVAEPTYDILSDYGSLHEEKSAVGDFEWTLLEDINETFHATEKDSDLVVLKSAKSYLLALTSNLGQASGATSSQRPRSTKPQAKPAAFKLHATTKPTKTGGQVKTATLHIQSNIPEEYYIRKSKVHSLHGRALKSRKGVN